MGKSRHHPSLASILTLAMHQHGVVTRAQLLDAGLSRQAIEHRLRTDRLHRIHRCVFAVGHPRLTREGRWMTAVRACGEDPVRDRNMKAAELEVLSFTRNGG